MADQTLIGQALQLLNRAIADQDRAERDGCCSGHGLTLYDPTERWDFVRGAREILRLAETERTPAREQRPVLSPA